MKRYVPAILAFLLLLTLATTVFAVTPESNGSTTATLAYNLKNLPLGRAVQYFYICDILFYESSID